MTRSEEKELNHKELCNKIKGLLKNEGWRIDPLKRVDVSAVKNISGKSVRCIVEAKIRKEQRDIDMGIGQLIRYISRAKSNPRITSKLFGMLVFWTKYFKNQVRTQRTTSDYSLLEETDTPIGICYLPAFVYSLRKIESKSGPSYKPIEKLRLIK